MAAPLRVLVVDDDDSVRALLALTFDGAEVVEAANAEQALAALGEHSFDAAVVDVMMPGVDGFALLARIRQSSQPDLSVVMLTARAGESDHLVAFQVGADAYVTKPFDVAHLVETVGTVAARTPAERVINRTQELSRAEVLRQLERRFGS